MHSMEHFWGCGLVFILTSLTIDALLVANSVIVGVCMYSTCSLVLCFIWAHCTHTFEQNHMASASLCRLNLTFKLMSAYLYSVTSCGEIWNSTQNSWYNNKVVPYVGHRMNGHKADTMSRVNELNLKLMKLHDCHSTQVYEVQDTRDHTPTQ